MLNLLLPVTFALLLAFWCWRTLKKQNILLSRKQIKALPPGLNLFTANWISAKYLLRNPSRLESLSLLCALARIYHKSGMCSFWIGPSLVILVYKAEQIEAVINNSERPFYYHKFGSPMLGNSLVMRTGLEWRNRRKLLNPAFHLQVLEKYLPVVNKQSKVLVQKLRECQPDEAVDILPYIQKCTLDIICESAMGVEIGSQKSSISVEYEQALHSTTEMMIQRFVYPWLFPDFIFYNLPVGRKFKKDVNRLKNFIAKIVSQKKEYLLKNAKVNAENIPSRKDEWSQNFSLRRKLSFMDCLLHHYIHEKTLSEEDIRDEVSLFTFAGHDSSTVSISWALFLTASYPEVQKRVHEELDKILAGDKERPITSDDIKQMTYLNCVVNEALRLYPPSGAIVRVITKDLTVGNYTLPSGASCLLFFHQLHRDRRYFPNPEAFKPDRFLPSDEKERHPFSFLPFSAGSKNCIGQRFAYNEQLILLADVFRNFSLKAAHGIEEVKTAIEVVFRPANPLRVFVTPRN